MSDGRLAPHQRAVQSPSWFSHESCTTPVFDMSWGHQAHQQMQQRQQPQQQISTPKQDDALCDFFADPDFKAWIATTICTPPRPPRASNFDPLASPASPGNWMLHLGCNTPFSPAKAAFEMHSRNQQPQPQGYTAAPELLRNMASVSACSNMPRMASAMPQNSEVLMRSSSVNCPLPLQLTDSPMLCQTPMQQPRAMSGSFAELGDFVASSTTRPTAAVNALHGSQPAFDPRATAMRRASNRVPKRSLEPDFDITQPEIIMKGRAARRGPIGPSKSRRPTFQGTGAVMPHNAAGETKGTKAPGSAQGVNIGSLSGIMSPFSLLKPSGSNGQTSLAELNKRIQEKADRPQPASSTDTSEAASSGQAGSITMNRLAKGVPVGSSPTIP